MCPAILRRPDQSSRYPPSLRDEDPRGIRSDALPLHPAGYALAISFAMDYFWFAFFISWLIKFVLLRSGGLGTHRKAMPFFLGLILGDYVTGSIWAIIGPLTGVRMYRIFI